MHKSNLTVNVGCACVILCTPVALFLDLPVFTLRLHSQYYTGAEDRQKTGKVWEHSSHEWTWGGHGCDLDVGCGGKGPLCQNNGQNHCSSALPRFRAPDFSMMETTHLDQYETRFQVYYVYI